MVDFILNAQVRSDLGKGASRRLRRNAGLVPAVVYGGDKEPQSVTLELREIAKLLENEAAFSHVIALNVGGAKETVLIKALQRHPAKGFVMHADFLRVVADHKLTAHVPLHFINEEVAVGVKQAGGEISHTISEVEVSCLPEEPAGIHRSRHGQGRAGPDRSPVGPQGSERRRAGTTGPRQRPGRCQHPRFPRGEGRR